MCYSVYLSTNSDENLGIYNSELINFERIDDNRDDPIVRLINFKNKWYVGSKSKCSCTFRHLSSVDLGFGVPEDWYPEEQDEIDATQELYEIINKLVNSGHEVDCLDSWEGVMPDEIKTIDVNINDVSKETFRLYENYKFRIIG